MKSDMNSTGRMAATAPIVAVVCLIGGLAGACSNSGSGFSDPIEDAIGDPLVMMGLKIDPNKEEIEYGPRSPLVMPTATENAQLPTPYEPTESYGEMWPDDPDERAKREFKAMQKAAMDEKPRDVEYASEPMTPGELDQWGRMYGRRNGAGLAVGTRADGKAENKVVSPRELLDRRLDPDQLTSEPARVTLSEPPPGYRTPAPPVEGYGETEQKKGFFARLFNRDGS
ncbi:hypothetical protein [Microbaculum marinum]|uniref:DUF3035 domain-containing protein n=1 Tax=Microbaculum marinum TaxID=1764581 RepID=A0AAW9RS58_9HYPH